MRVILMAIWLVLSAACGDDATPPAPDAAFTTPSEPPPACLPGWHPEGNTCVPD